MSDERVRHIMTEAVLSIGIAEPVTEMIRLFASYPVHHLPVVDGGRVKGMLSSADLLKLESFIPRAGAAHGAAFLNDRFKVAALMRSPVFKAKPEDTIEEAASHMVAHAVHALPVVNEDDHLVGIVTTTDIMQALLHGMGLKRATERSSAPRRPTELEMRGALEAAENAVLDGDDPKGVAAALLYLHRRNGVLEELHRNVARYLHGGGADSRLHARITKEIEQLADSADESNVLI